MARVSNLKQNQFQPEADTKADTKNFKMGDQKNCKRASPGGPGCGSAAARKLILIDSVVYDVTRFNHPGGHVMDYLCFSDMNRCIDASAAFHEFHFRTDSKKMRAYLASLPKVEGKFKLRYDENETSRRTLLTKDFFEMRKRLESEGVFDLCKVHVFLRCLEIICLFALGSFLVTTSLGGQTIMAGLLKVLFGALMLGLAQGRCGWLMHEAGHRSLTGVPKTDQRIQEVIFGLGGGMSAKWWNSQHNRHHATPQKLEHDVDLDTMPLVAFNDHIASKVKPNTMMAKWIKHQAYLFMPFTNLLAGLFWRFFLHPRYVWIKRSWAEAGWMLLHHAAWAALFIAGHYSFSAALAVYLFSNAFSFSYIFVNFAALHSDRETSQPDEFLHWVEYSSEHTTNVTSESWSGLLNWWLAGNQWHIEHHLFPQAPHFRLGRARPAIKELLQKHNLTYDERPYTSGLADVFTNLARVADGIPPESHSLPKSGNSLDDLPYSALPYDRMPAVPL